MIRKRRVLRAVTSHAIGFADPGPGAHSPEFGASRGGGSAQAGGVSAPPAQRWPPRRWRAAGDSTRLRRDTGCRQTGPVGHASAAGTCAFLRTAAGGNEPRSASCPQGGLPVRCPKCRWRCRATARDPQMPWQSHRDRHQQVLTWADVIAGQSTFASVGSGPSIDGSGVHQPGQRRRRTRCTRRATRGRGTAGYRERSHQDSTCQQRRSMC